MTTPTFRHDSDRKRFVLTVDGTVAELNYREVDAKTLDYYRTFVPSTLRGGGIAKQFGNHVRIGGMGIERHVVLGDGDRVGKRKGNEFECHDRLVKAD